MSNELTCLIERIIQTGKKKLVLDHVIVQKMDDEEGGSDVRSILTYGAQALFDETAETRNITCALNISIRYPNVHFLFLRF